MSFFQSKTGKQLTGSEEDSFAGGFKIIPDGTTAPAMIKTFLINESDAMNQFYEIQWKLVDGEFKGTQVRQKIACFDTKAEKAERALNMLLRLFKLLKIDPTENAPTEEDLAPMQGKILGIKIQEWSMDGKNGNWVSEVHIADAAFMTETGKKIEATSRPVDSALTRNQRAASVGAEDDIPF